MDKGNFSHAVWPETEPVPGRVPLLLPNGLSQCRLSLTSGTPVTTSDVTGATALLLEAYVGNRIVLPTDWGEWRAFTLPRTPAGLYEISQSLVAASPFAIAAATVYDVFAYLDSRGLVNIALGPAYSGNARATALGLRDGARVLSTIPSWLYVGTIYASAANAIDDSATKRFVWNAYNRVPRNLLNAVEGTDSWTYTTDAWRQANANVANQVEAVLGLAEAMMDLLVVSACFNNVAGYHGPGIGIDSTSADSSQLRGYRSGNSGVANLQIATYRGYPGVGYHKFVWLERSVASGTTTWYGDNGIYTVQSGIMGTVFA